MSNRGQHPNIQIVNTQPEYVEYLAEMQHLIFPTLTDEELLSAAQYQHHIKLFPEGQFTALVQRDGKWMVAGSTSTFRINWEKIIRPHTFLEVIDNGWLNHHNSRGKWLYGADLSIHPDFRRLGLGSELYKARAALVQRLNLAGEAAGGMLPGYHHHRHHLTIEQYVQKVVAGEVKDPTLSMQLRNGFKVKGILYDHITDPRANNCAAFIVRENPHYYETHV